MFRSLLLAATLVSSCGDSRPRCEQCGMYADTDERWTVRGQSALYDTPKCALRAEGTNESLRFVSYYEGTSTAGADIVFVRGSDLQGPMGADLVPVERAQAEHFIADHGGEALEYNAIDEAVLESL